MELSTKKREKRSTGELIVDGMLKLDDVMMNIFGMM